MIVIFVIPVKMQKIGKSEKNQIIKKILIFWGNCSIFNLILYNIWKRGELSLYNIIKGVYLREKRGSPV